MKVITIAVALSLLFAVQSALADEGTGKTAKSEEGFAIAEQLLLREDLSEPLPAKEEKVDQKKSQKATDENLGEAPLLGGEVKSEDEAASAEGAGDASPAAVMEKIVNDEQKSEEPAPAAGSLTFEMDTVNLLADAPTEPTFEQAPAEASVAKR